MTPPFPKLATTSEHPLVVCRGVTKQFGSNCDITPVHRRLRFSKDMLRKLGSRGWLEASNAGRRYPADADPAMLAWTVDEMANSDVEVLIAMFELVSNADAAPYLPKIRAPMLALYPRTGGVITSNEHLEILHEKVADIRIVRVDSASHSLQFTSPATCALEVLHFISRNDGIPCHEA